MSGFPSPPGFTLPAANRNAFTLAPYSDMNNVLNALISTGALGNVMNQAGATADPTGAIDSAAAINEGLQNGLGILPGVFMINSPVFLNQAGMRLTGFGAGMSGLVAGPSYSGGPMVQVTADSCVIDHLSLAGASGTVASNPAVNGIQITGAQHTRVRNIYGSLLNGYLIESLGATATGNLDTMITDVIGRQCAGGIHLQGVSGSSFAGEHFLSGIQLQRIGGGSGSIHDAMLLEDIGDVIVQNYNGSVLGGSAAGITCHVKGACFACFFTNTDIGMITRGTVSPTLLVESGTNGSPSGLGWTGGIMQAGNVGVEVDAGIDIGFHSIKIKNNTTDNVLLTGGDQVVFDADCNFATGNQAGGASANDVHITSSTGFFHFIGDYFASPVNATPTAGSVTNPVNDVNHRGFFEKCHFAGSGNTPSTVFSGTAQIVRDCAGYSPRGSITAPTITTGTFSSNTSQHDVTIIFLTIGGMTAFKIGGTAVGVLPVAGFPYHVPARQTLEVDSATTAPTWQWLAD